jgi:hydrogenase/urease accessory protein HupE
MRHNPGFPMKRAAACVLFLLAAGPAWAHDEKFSSSSVEVKDDVVIWRVDVALQGLQKVFELPADPLDLTERQLQGLKPEIVRYLRTCMKVRINGVPVEPEAGSLEPVTETFIASGEKYIAHARQTFRYSAPSPVRRVELAGAFFKIYTDQHHAVLAVTWTGFRRSYSRTGEFELDLTAAGVRSAATDFILWGMRLLLTGADHLAFLLALLLAARTLGDMVRVATSFAVAHSITLLLAAKEWIRLPPAATEAFIALSVVYVAAENLFIKDGRHRWVLAFAFGLVHGLGFSDSLRDRLRDLDSIALPAASFNVGIELGQLAILLVAFPLLQAIRKAPEEESAARRQRLLVRIGSAPLVLLGLGWLADRAFHLKFIPF